MIKFLLLLPLIASAISGLFLRKRNEKISEILTISFMGISAILATINLIVVGIGKKSYNSHLFTFISDAVKNFGPGIEFGFLIDPLSSIMLVVVTYISLLVHIYSVGYMKGDESKVRFMSYLSLFTFFMLILVTSNNFIQMFFGWEGVGLCSYLLIGFWHQKKSANIASIKAFIVNRVADFGFIIGICLIYTTFGSFEFANIFPNVALSDIDRHLIFGIELTKIDIICIFLFIGAMGKSAQFLLHTWLPDAMEGPTPVSALIHAATMVTAGIFMVARCSYLFEYSQIALNMVVFVGALTAIFAATIAIVQNDIKKIIAYSTCSQLGYMFFICGLSSYSTGIFHLFTHAFFKALLFLSAGSVICALHHEQDIRKMGDGLFKKIPVTYVCFWIGSLAIAGFPPFAGYFSKDVILEIAYISEGKMAKFAYISGILTAFLTAFYSWRLIFVAFHGKNDSDDHSHTDHDHSHHEISEKEKFIKFPIIILSFFSVFAGIFGHYILKINSAEGNYFGDAIYSKKMALLEEIHHLSFLVKSTPMIVSLLAIFLSYLFYIKFPSIPQKLAKNLKFIYRILLDKYCFDEFYNKLFVINIQKLGRLFWNKIDVKLIDLTVNSVALLCKKLSAKLSKCQTGYIYNYNAIIVSGMAVFLMLVTLYYI